MLIFVKPAQQCLAHNRLSGSVLDYDNLLYFKNKAQKERLIEGHPMISPKVPVGCWFFFSTLKLNQTFHVSCFCEGSKTLPIL